MQHNRLTAFLNELNHTWCIIYISLAWVLGLLIGFAFCASVPNATFEAFAPISGHSTSIVRLLFVAFAPLLLSLLLHHYHRNYLAYILIFTKALLFSFSFAFIEHAYSGAGWLIRFFCMFPELAAVTILLWFWISNIRKTALSGNEVAVSLSTLLFICCADCFILSPFWLTLNHS